MNYSPDVQTEKPAGKSEGKLAFLDGLRGIAAVYVVLGHGRALLWEGYSGGYVKHAEAYSPWEKLQMYFFSLFKFGHEAVLFFFVLSGFVIHYKYAAAYARRNAYDLDLPGYIKKRSRRIYPPFIFALLLTFVLDLTGSKLGFPIYKGGTGYTALDDAAGTSHDLTTFAGNLLFLYKAYVPVFGTNGPAWSLKFEWWFYMLYPIFLFFGTKRVWVPAFMVLALYALSVTTGLPERLSEDVFSMMCTWWVGVLLADVHFGRIKIKMSRLSWLMLTALLFPFTPKLHQTLYYLNLAVFFSGMLAFFLSAAPRWATGCLGKIKPVGDFSYTLYILHYPIIVFISGWILTIYNGILPKHSLFILPVTMLVMGVCYLVHFITERPFVGRRKN